MFLNNNVVSRAVATLELDPENPRLIGFIENKALKKPRDILLTLTLNYDVLDICNSILSNGYYPEFNIVTIPKDPEGRKLIVVEGNRRTSACKILLKPELLSGTAYSNMIDKIKNHKNYKVIKDSVRKINVVILNNRDDAETYKALKHTRQTIKSWSPYTQGGYFVSKLSTGTSLSELRVNLNISEIKINQIQRVVLFFRLASEILRLTCWSPEERQFLEKNKDELKIESIIRLIQSKLFSEVVGCIKINEFGEIVHPQINKQQFKFILEVLTRDSHFLEGKSEGDFILSTRQENKGKLKDYIEKLKADLESTELDAPDLIEFVDDNHSDLELESVITTNESNSSIIRKKPRQWDRLLPKDIVMPSNSKKLESLVVEAIKLDVKKYPYSASLLARSIFEVTLKLWIKNKGLEKILTKEYKERAFDFNNLLIFANKNIDLLICDDQDAKKAIRQVTNSLLTSQKEILNLTNHNDISILSESEVSHIKDKLHTFCAYFLPRMID
ncbi:hypothetical protein [Pantoea agglomerans]|uniref:hypothetical protein n=1 Tax=Enterobacter agglomerans TaxID=549 RepID=UPI001559189A|nr:hypothetical protein [Pantoea agglomerans]NQS82092.1 hypothetical protein [Pantoea agglomerans]